MRRAVKVPGLVLAFLALANSGCLAVAVGTAAAGGAVGYAYWRGNVWQEYPAGFEPAWTAAQAALLDLGLPLTGVERESTSEGTLKSQTGDGTSVTITLETRPGRIPAEGPVTRVNVRVGLWGDPAVSERLLAQVQARLSAAPEVVPLPPAQTAPPPLGAPEVVSGS
ncbi:MAG: DUF3568 domain-containing protein [Gemmataceae bacterium]|nr:DUF3568 domain-containing protein [Gemmataceae bacterium]